MKIIKRNTKDKLVKLSKKEKAITLIALVITIICLLILAGITIRDFNWRKWNNYKSTRCKGFNKYFNIKRRNRHICCNSRIE